MDILNLVEMRLSKLKDLYPYSNNNDAYNCIINLCIEVVREIKEEQKSNNDNNIRKPFIPY